MTSTVKVTAHCSSEKEVLVELNGLVHDTIQNNESKEYYVYDELYFTISEVKKKTDAGTENL